MICKHGAETFDLPVKNGKYDVEFKTEKCDKCGKMYFSEILYVITDEQAGYVSVPYPKEDK